MPEEQNNSSTDGNGVMVDMRGQRTMESEGVKGETDEGRETMRDRATRTIEQQRYKYSKEIEA